LLRLGSDFSLVSQKFSSKRLDKFDEYSGVNLTNFEDDEEEDDYDDFDDNNNNLKNNGTGRTNANLHVV
jgi:hypothetical protein